MVPHDSFAYELPGEGTGRREEWGDGRKIGNHQRLIPGLCLEAKID